jgi:hypothetical protein
MTPGASSVLCAMPRLSSLGNSICLRSSGSSSFLLSCSSRIRARSSEDLAQGISQRTMLRARRTSTAHWSSSDSSVSICFSTARIRMYQAARVRNPRASKLLYVITWFRSKPATRRRRAQE